MVVTPPVSTYTVTLVLGVGDPDTVAKFTIGDVRAESAPAAAAQVATDALGGDGGFSYEDLIEVTATRDRHGVAANLLAPLRLTLSRKGTPKLSTPAPVTVWQLLRQLLAHALRGRGSDPVLAAVSWTTADGHADCLTGDVTGLTGGGIHPRFRFCTIEARTEDPPA